MSEKPKGIIQEFLVFLGWIIYFIAFFLNLWIETEAVIILSAGMPFMK